MVINQAQKQETANPCKGGLPLEPVQSLRQDRRTFFLFNDIESAAVNHPDLRWFTDLCHRFLFRQTAVEPREVVGGTNPHDGGKYVEPPEKQINPFCKIWAHVLYALAPPI